MLVDIFGAHMARNRRTENLEDFQAGQRDFQSCFAEIASFDVLHGGPYPSRCGWRDF